jgi:tRNA G46 methylase TrmB
MVSRGLTAAQQTAAMSSETTETLAVQAEGWRRITPSPSAEQLKAFYAGEYFQASHGTYAQAYSETELAHRRLLARLLLAAIGEGRGGASGGKLLEIGCGEGWFLRSRASTSPTTGSAASIRSSSTAPNSATPSRSSTA